jgi:SAM-dependent methyltransferase
MLRRAGFARDIRDLVRQEREADEVVRPLENNQREEIPQFFEEREARALEDVTHVDARECREVPLLPRFHKLETHEEVLHEFPVVIRVRGADDENAAVLQHTVRLAQHEHGVCDVLDDISRDDGVEETIGIRNGFDVEVDFLCLDVIRQIDSRSIGNVDTVEIFGRVVGKFGITDVESLARRIFVLCDVLAMWHAGSIPALVSATSDPYTRRMVTEKKTCRLCHGANLENFLDLGEQPLANAFLKPEHFDQEQFYPLITARCGNPDCGFIQLAHVVDAETLFSDYVYVSSTSPVFVKHFEEYARKMAERVDVNGRLTVDIGSNDGILLKPLKALGAKALGVDLARDIAAKATSEGLETITAFFTEEFAKKVEAERGKAVLITANNAFAHIDDLDDVVKGVRTLLAKDGLFAIEAPYLIDFLEKKLFDLIYHEHLSYLSIRPLQAFFKRYNMRIVDVDMVDTHGGSARMIVAHADSAFTEQPIVQQMIDEEVSKGLHEAAVYRQFGKEVMENKDAVYALLSDLKKQGKKIAGYGAPAKGNTLLNFMNIGTDLLDYIVDDSPLKQGLYTPGTHIPVVPASRLTENTPDYLFILAWNFAPSIMKKNADFAANGGKFIIPVPSPAIV